MNKSRISLTLGVSFRLVREIKVGEAVPRVTSCVSLGCSHSRRLVESFRKHLVRLKRKSSAPAELLLPLRRA